MFPIITSVVSLHMITHKMHTRHYSYFTLIHSSFCVLSSKSFERRPNFAQVWAACYTWSRHVWNVNLFSFSRTSGLPSGTCNRAAKIETKYYTHHCRRSGNVYWLTACRLEVRVMTITGNRRYRNRTRETRDTGTEHRGKREIQGPNNTRNARYRKRTTRETWDTGTGHRGKREIQGPNTRNPRYRDGTLRETRDTGNEHHEKLEMEEPSIMGNTRYRNGTWQASWHTGMRQRQRADTDDMLFPRLLST